MRDVAERAGVSPATVSNVLGDRKPVDPALAERVRRAAAELDYRVDRAASLLRSRRTQVVAVLVPSLENPFFTALIAAVERAVRAQDYDIVIASSSDDERVERARLATLLAWRPAGVIIVPSTDTFASRHLLAQHRVPAVVVDRLAPAHPGDTVLVDNGDAAALAARHLLGLGHRDTLVVASTLELANIRARCSGIVDMHRRLGLPAPDVLEVGLSFEEIGNRIEQHLAEKGRPTGVIALTNFATLGVISAFKHLNLAVPDDISLIGFDDYAWMSVSTPSITAVRQPVEAMATAAWDLLRERLEGGDRPAATVSLRCGLEIRQSTRAVGRSLLEAGAAGRSGPAMAHASQGRST